MTADVAALAWPTEGERPQAHTGWEPERCLVGAVLHLDVEQTRPLLDLVRDDDLADPLARIAWALIRELVSTGHPADPSTVTAQAQRTGVHGTPHNLDRFGYYLTTAFTAVPVPSNAPEYARAVLDDSYRRGWRRFGERLVEHAGTASRDDLEELAAAERTALLELRSRLTRSEGT
ncbi:DnaB-like helicase N-terminal domain-containing protein [Rhodococcus pyridinivorans]|uniref:DnaB-like helicase N-terminal domain-containing protein n=1 Tax=Rhodococcus pyridinivorans TaxID=103816 RepID=UPI003446835D